MSSLEMKECTFQPEKYNADELLAATRPVLLGETSEQRFERLSRDDWARVTTARQAIHDAYYTRFTYQPVINEHSRVRACVCMYMCVYVCIHRYVCMYVLCMYVCARM